VNVGFWMSRTTLFVQQFDARGERAPACRLHDVQDRVWRQPSGGCLSSDFNYLARVDRGPRGLLGLHSSAEGHFALEIVQYDPSTGQAETSVQPVIIEGASTVSVRFAPDGAHVDLVTPCVLEGGSPFQCVEFDRMPAWRLYSLALADGEMRLRRSDLPPGASLHPRSESFAWMREGSICVGEPKAPRARCFPVPAG
jgi:hypothetical protein